MMWLFKPSSDKSPWELPMKWLANFEYNKKARSKPSRYPLLMWFERRHINWDAILYSRSGQSLVSLVDNEAYLTDLSDLYVSVIFIFWLCLFFIFFTGTVVRKVSKVRYLTNYYFIISVAHINRHLGFVPRYELLPSLPLCTFCAWFIFTSLLFPWIFTWLDSPCWNPLFPLFEVASLYPWWYPSQNAWLWSWQASTGLKPFCPSPYPCP